MTTMRPSASKSVFEERVRKSGAAGRDLTVEQGVRQMLDFYRDVRAEGCDLTGDGDMLLFQWGTYDLGGERTFRFDLTRQFIVETPDGDLPISQLSLTFHFAPSADLDQAGEGDRWCDTPDGLGDFEAFIASSAARRAVGASRASKVELTLQDV